MAGQEIRAFNVATAGFAAGLVGPSRSRIQGILVYATNITAFTIKNGTYASGCHSAGLDSCQRGGTMCFFLMMVFLLTMGPMCLLYQALVQ